MLGWRLFEIRQMQNWTLVRMKMWHALVKVESMNDRIWPAERLPGRKNTRRCLRDSIVSAGQNVLWGRMLWVPHSGCHKVLPSLKGIVTYCYMKYNCSAICATWREGKGIGKRTNDLLAKWIIYVHLHCLARGSA